MVRGGSASEKLESPAASVVKGGSIGVNVSPIDFSFPLCAVFLLCFPVPLLNWSGCRICSRGRQAPPACRASRLTSFLPGLLPYTRRKDSRRCIPDAPLRGGMRGCSPREACRPVGQVLSLPLVG